MVMFQLYSGITFKLNLQVFICISSSICLCRCLSFKNPCLRIAKLKKLNSANCSQRSAIKHSESRTIKIEEIKYRLITCVVTKSAKIKSTLVLGFHYHPAPGLKHWKMGDTAPENSLSSSGTKLPSFPLPLWSPWHSSSPRRMLKTWALPPQAKKSLHRVAGTQGSSIRQCVLTM